MSKLGKFVGEHIQKDMLDNAAKAIKEYDLIRKSEGDYFLDIDNCTHPEAFKAIGNAFLYELGNINEFYHVDKLAFIEKEIGSLGMMPFAAYLSEAVDIPIVYVKIGRESPNKVKGREVLYYGETKPRVEIDGEHIVPLIDGYDGTNLYELLKSAEVIRNAGGSVRAAVALVSKSYANRNKLADNGIDPTYVFDTNMLLNAGIITNDNITWPTEPVSAVMKARTGGIDDVKP